MLNNFDKAFELILLFEGGYVNHPDDPGGETKYGISKKAYPGADIAALTIEQAKQIYKDGYWIPAHCIDLPYPIDIIHFDTAVNCGVRTANKILQNAINESRDELIKADGIIGKQTLDAMSDPERIATNYLFNRIRYYVQINKPVFLVGWINRVLSLRARI